MAEGRLAPMEEARVRTAALVAAQRMNWTVPRAVLDYIIATSDPRQGPAALEMRAAGIVEYVRNHPDRPEFANATDGEARGFFRMIHGQVVSRFGGLPWALALAREEETSDRGGSAAYDSALVSDDMITPGNYHRSRFGNRGVGVPEGVYHDLLGQGYTRDQIYNAGRQANLLGFRGDQRMVRAQALIQRYDSNPDDTNQAMLRYRDGIRGDQELRDLYARHRGAVAANNTALIRQLEEQIERRYEHHRRESGLAGRRDDPGNTPEGRRGIRESDELIIQQEEALHGYQRRLGDQASLDATAEALLSGRVTPTVSGTLSAPTSPTAGLLATVTAAPEAGAGAHTPRTGSLLATVTAAPPDPNPARPSRRLAHTVTSSTPTLTG